MLHLGFLIAAFILFLLAAAGVAHPRCNLMALGLALLTLALLFPGPPLLGH